MATVWSLPGGSTVHPGSPVQPGGQEPERVVRGATYLFQAMMCYTTGMMPFTRAADFCTFESINEVEEDESRRI